MRRFDTDINKILNRATMSQITSAQKMMKAMSTQSMMSQMNSVNKMIESTTITTQAINAQIASAQQIMSNVKTVQNTILNDSGIQNMLKNIASVNNFINTDPSIREVIKNVATVQDIIKKSTLVSAVAVHDIFAKSATLKGLVSSVALAQNIVAKSTTVGDLITNINSVIHINDEAENNNVTDQTSEQLDSSYYNDITEAYNIFPFEENTKDELKSKLDDIETNIIQQVQNVSTTKKRGDYLSITLAIIFFIYGVISDYITNQDIKNKLNDIEEKIIILEESENKMIDYMIDSFNEKQEKPVLYVVLRDVNLRVRPSTKNEIITVLHPNQEVKLEDTKSKWIYVTYFDHTEEITRSGWVNKKYLKRL